MRGWRRGRRNGWRDGNGDGNNGRSNCGYAGETLRCYPRGDVVTVLVLVVVLVAGLLLAPRSMRGALIPRSWRVAYRRAHGREGARSAYVSPRLRRRVMAADRYRCVLRSGCSGGLEVDHYRPWAGGGRTILSNCFALCHWHNRVKSNYWRARDGYVFYRPFSGADDRVLAAAVLAAERRARRNPCRYVRAMVTR
jgi:hypothetical protein